MIQGKSHHAESRAKTRKASAAPNRIQGKTTKESAALPARKAADLDRPRSPRRRRSRSRTSQALASQPRDATGAEPGDLATVLSSPVNGVAA